jgi:hypothetical protein
MVRTQIQLTEEQAQRLKAAARRKCVSQAELIRRYVDKMLPLDETRSDEEIRRRAIAVAGKLRSKTGDVAARHNEYLSEAFDS